MEAMISGDNLFIIVYALSMKGLTYMVLSSGTTIEHQITYRSKYDDGQGNVDFGQLPHAVMAHFLFDFLPLIDKFNKTCQYTLALEKL